MKFHRVVGKVDKKLAEIAEGKLSKAIIDLAVGYSNKATGTKLGGDPFIFSLLQPVQHICTLNMPTAATDGKRFYWNPKFIIKLTQIGLRIVCYHEAGHAIYMHPQRRGSRLAKLWNIAVDYIVNNMAMEDLKSRGFNATSLFKEHLGDFRTIDEFVNMIKNPYEYEAFLNLQKKSNVKLPGPNDDQDLTSEQIEELERLAKPVRFFYADPDILPNMKRPEKIYDYLYALLPKCSKCGSVGMYKRPHDHGDGKPCTCPDHKHDKGGCEECGDGIDIFDLGGTMDDHMDSEESEENMAKRLANAMDTAKKMSGHIPAGMEDELGALTAPKITWQDVVRTKMLKSKMGNSRNDWNRFRSRPMFYGMMAPKKKNFEATFGCLIDTSGSMRKEDIAYGVSQLISLDRQSEGTITPADATIYWEESVKIKKASAEELKSKIKIVGRGGTLFSDYFKDYHKKIGKCDFLIVITDGFLDTLDLSNMIDPGVPVVWLITSICDFQAPFGRVFKLQDY
jgi:predicted metal-dependent peptidase